MIIVFFQRHLLWWCGIGLVLLCFGERNDNRTFDCRMLPSDLILGYRGQRLLVSLDLLDFENTLFMLVFPCSEFIPNIV